MYIPLYVKTDYSLLTSLIRIDDLIKECLNKKITSIAVCDNNLSYAMEFYNKSINNKIKPIIGLDLSFDNYNILLYVKNNIGYKNLIKIETLKNQKELNIDKLKEYREGLIAILKYNYIENYSLFKNIFDELYIGINNKKEEKECLNKEVVFINETLYLEPNHYKYLPYLHMIRDAKTITDGINYSYQNNYLLEDVDHLASNKALNNTLKISDKCNLKLDGKEIYMPKFQLENNVIAKDYLKKLCYLGLSKRLNNNLTNFYLKRLEYELDIIDKMNFSDYFLVVYDFIKYAKKRDILVGPGRGSAAGSLVSYTLGITDVDPIKYNLLFERFLNPERITLPDIDTDFPDDDREIVIDYVINKYGRDKTSNIITFGTLGAKQALRDVGRVLNVELKDIDFLCKKLSFNDSLKKLEENSEIFNIINNDDKLKLMYEIARIIENNKRHSSTHAAGIVISYKSLDEILPLTFTNDIIQTEYAMDYLEQVGLIKIDFLGNGYLTATKNIINDINEKEQIKINFNDIPLDDINVFKLFQMGDTTGIFQFESEGMKKFLRDLKPTSMEDIFAAMALFRPGPSANIPSYINRKYKKEEINYFDKSLEKVLMPTYGIIIYQEQIMQIASIMAGYSLGESDILRRAMSKKKIDLLMQEEEKFIKNSIKNGYSESLSKDIYNLILKFAGYGFNRSHSVSYSLISYKMAYLKVYYTKYFYSNLLTNNISSENKTKEYIMEAKKRGISFKLPDVNISTNKYEVIDNSIILPISLIKNIGIVVASYILNKRITKYNDIYDFLIKTYDKTNNKKVYESLVFSSFFDSFSLNKKTLIENKEVIYNYVDLIKDLENSNIEKPELMIFDEYDKEYLLEKEKEIFGLYLTSHKTEKYKIKEDNIIDVSLLKKHFNKVINIIVNVDIIKEINTKNNELMAFVVGSDVSGDVSITLFPKIYKNQSIKKGDILKIIGKVEKRYNDYQIVANKIDILNN